jgi:hypothetical protein
MPALHPKPGLASTRPTVAEVDRDVIEWFVEFCKRHFITAETLSGIIGGSESLAKKKMTGAALLSARDIAMFPERWRFELTHFLNGYRPKLRAHG